MMTDPIIAPPGYSRIDPFLFRSVCEIFERPLVITGWLKIWMCQHFNGENINDLNPVPTNTGIPDNALTQAIYNPDYRQTKIMIESVHAFKPELCEGRPALLVQCRAYKKVKLGVDDRMMFTNTADGQEYFTTWMSGTHTIWCLNGDGSECMKFASEVFRELNEFSSFTRKLLDLKRFEAQEIGEMMVLKTDSIENFAIPVTVSCVYEEAWRYNQESALLRQLSYNIDLAIFQP